MDPGNVQNASMTSDLIATFEDEQKTTVFSALVHYLHENVFCDISLSVGHQMLQAHKVVLASSSKFFRDTFKHCGPTLTSLDLERELAPHGLSLTFEDVRLIIGILYCVGTVEISPPRVESLLLVAQVMGIPSLIRFLKRIKTSIIGLEDQNKTSKKCHPGVLLVPNNANGLNEFNEPSLMSPPSRSQSRATLASLGSFSLQPIASPGLKETTDTNPSRVVSSVFDGLDPSFLNQLNNLQDLESALLPHLHTNSSIATATLEKGQRPNSPEENASPNTTTGTFLTEEQLETLNVVDESFNTTVELPKQEQLLVGPRPQRPMELPLGSSTPLPHHHHHQVEPLNLNLNRMEADHGNAAYGIVPVREASFVNTSSRNVASSLPTFSQLMPSGNQNLTAEPVRLGPAGPVQVQPDPLIIDHNEEHEDLSEIKVPLDTVEESQSFTFAIPGTSRSVTLNFSADALAKMRTSVTSKQKEDDDNCVSSSTGVKRKKNKKGVLKKSHYKCQLCGKNYPSKRLLDKHLLYHVDQNSTCKECGKLFYKKWMLEQHLAVDHGQGEAMQCKDCGKEFKWHRNLLAHMLLMHQKEIRYRCKNCPLTFLRKKSYINHHKGKHADAPQPWCKFCLEIFDSRKQREEHTCDSIENTGSTLICHKHSPAMVFKQQEDLFAHMVDHHDDKEGDEDEPRSSGVVQKCCPVCHKKFLLRKNLVTHMKRFHEVEGKNGRFPCTFCQKLFFYDNDRAAHENIHTGQKKFKCACGKEYSSKKSLQDHSKLVHSVHKETHKCHICQKQLRDKYKLKYHMMVHTEKRNFKCGYCSVEFKARENLQKHVVKFHLQEEQETTTTSVVS